MHRQLMQCVGSLTCASPASRAFAPLRSITKSNTPKPSLHPSLHGCLRSMHSACCMTEIRRPAPAFSSSVFSTLPEQRTVWPSRWCGRSMSSSSTAHTSTEAPAIQRLYQTAEQHLAATPHMSPVQVQELRDIAGSVTLTEMGFPEHLVQNPSLVTEHLSKLNRAHPFLKGHVTYLHIHDCARFSMGIFMLPAGTCIPLHNHPGMTVISNLLFGTMHLKAYDPLIVDPGSEDSSSPSASPSSPMSAPAPSSDRLAFPQRVPSWSQRVTAIAATIKSQLIGKYSDEDTEGRFMPARLVVDKTVNAPHEALVLFPNSCNIHEFTAVTDCAVLDLLTPPYNEDEGRDCTYFQEIESQPSGGMDTAESKRGVGDIALLEPVYSEFFTKSAQYLGIPVSRR